MKILKRSILIIITATLLYHFLWMLDPFLAKVYDVVTQQSSVKKYSKNHFQLIPFVDLPVEEKAKFSAKTCEKFTHQQEQFIKINWFDRYRNLIGTLKPYHLLTPDRLIGNYFRIPNLAKTQYLLVSPKLLTAYNNLIQALQKNQALDSAPITVTSGFRNPNYNQLVGGASCSQHQLGTAMDVSVGDVNKDGMVDLKDRQVVYNLLNQDIIGSKGGIGTYKNLSRVIHFDVRGYRARW